MMPRQPKIYVAGHRGMVGSAIVRSLQQRGQTNVVTRKNWLRSRSTLDFLGLWKLINNPNFKGVEFDSFKNQADANSFTLSPSKWIEETGGLSDVANKVYTSDLVGQD